MPINEDEQTEIISTDTNGDVNFDINLEFEEICQEVNSIKNSLTSLMSKIRQYKKKVDKTIKDNGKDIVKTTKVPKEKKEKVPKEKKEKVPKEKKPKNEPPPSAMTIPCSISPELAKFLDKPSDTKMVRTEVTKELYKYIKDNKLQDQTKKMTIKPNQALIDLLCIDEKQELTYFNIQGLMNKHYLHDNLE
jgi:chromatin remodeling complex protein RSC6